MINIHTQPQKAEAWLNKHHGLPTFVCVLGFTETALIPGISAAGLTPLDRKYTACADAEFLYHGACHQPKYPLPPLTAGASPVLISRAVVEELQLPLYIFNAGLIQAPTLSINAIDLKGTHALCVSSGNAMKLSVVRHLFQQGLDWGERLGRDLRGKYLILSECVVGGTTTALAILTGLGINAAFKVNSSHPVCNHDQKLAIVRQGLEKMGKSPDDPFELVASVGDPMQIVVAGMAIAASRFCGVMLAGGTQMLAVYALSRACANFHSLEWQPEEIVVGTTRWVALDKSGATIELASLIGDVPLIATQLNLTNSRYEQLRAYERGFVKEGVGAGAACIAAYLYKDWQQQKLVSAIEKQLEKLSNNQ
jgi:uncharacterized protein (TIGR00303 family)